MMGDERVEAIKTAVKEYLTSRLTEADDLCGLSFNVSALGINFVVDVQRRTEAWQAVEPVERREEEQP